MFPRQRRAEMLDEINRIGRVSVDDLAGRYDISVDSIRKDLQQLAKAGKCRRVYGGAVKIAPEAPEKEAGEPGTTPLASTDEAAVGRLAVARRAFVEINDGDSIFLDISRTNVILARLLAESDKRVILTTNMIDVLKEVSTCPRITALGTGGYLNEDLTGFIGSATVSLLEPLLFSKAFIGTSGIDPDRNAVMADSFDSGAVKMRVVENASYKFLLADAGKFDKRGLYRFASIDEFTAVITDESSLPILEKIQRRGIPTLMA
ncbi:DeoR/GlpR transcriptional regulator [Coriobacteriales bacterium OH1046]|nr:DeoR/GlpR transcriptional regulator [Coriobacteriales bacterium OH1046]